jgi:chemotaxis protein histidine kinase CheA
MMMHDEASKAAMRAQARHEKTQTPEEKALADQAARTLTVALRAVEDTMHAVSELSVGREGLDVLAATANHFAEASEASARVAQIVDRIADKLFVR